MQNTSYFRLCVYVIGLAFVLLAIRPPVAPAGGLIQMEKMADASTDASEQQEDDDFSGLQSVEEEQHLAVKSPCDAWSIPSKECALPADCHEQRPFALVLESLPIPPDAA